MKRSLFFIVLMAVLFMPVQGFAIGAGEEYEYLNFEETLDAEEIEPEFSSYKESDDQAVIYLFRGDGCSFCISFLSFLNSITDEYGDYFRVVSYEVWNDAKNNDLMDEVSEFLDKPAGGVPYIVIGDQVFAGYSERYDESIKNAIMDLYSSKDKYDVFEEMEIAQKEANKSTSAQSVTVIIWNAVFCVISVIVIVSFIHKKDKKLSDKLAELEKKLNTNK